MSFRRCTQCGREWDAREAFLADPAITLSGCQVDTDHPQGSALLFDHKVKDCGTTMGVPIRFFADLHTEAPYRVNWSKSAKCPRKCFDPKNLDSCPAECSVAYVREILQVVRRMTANRQL